MAGKHSEVMMSIWQRILGSAKRWNKLTEQQQFLRTVVALRHLNRFELLRFEALLHERVYEAGEVIYKAGFPHVMIYFIVDGEVLIYKKGEETTPVSQLSRSGHFGAIELFGNNERVNTAIASKRTKLLAISKNEMKDYIQTNPKAGIKLLSGFCQSLSELVMQHIFTTPSE